MKNVFLILFAVLLPISVSAYTDHSAGGSSLTVEEEDGTPSVSNVTTRNVTNGTLTDNGSGDVSIVTGGGGGSGDIQIENWTALSFEFMENGDSFPAPGKDVISGAQYDVNYLAFDDTTEECASKFFILSDLLDTGGTVNFIAMGYPSTASANDVVLRVRNDELENDEEIGASTSSSATDICTMINTQDDLVKCEFTQTISNLGWAAEDLVYIEFCRDADDVSDDHVGDWHLISFQMRIPLS